MNALVVCVSVSHGNTKRIARAMAEVLGAEVVDPEEVDPATLGGYDLVGFGSGIYAMSYHPRLRALIERSPEVPGTRAFVFSTSGAPEPGLWPYSRRLGARLSAKGYDVVDTFSCRGWDTWLPLRLVGGLNKGRPGSEDFAAARRFAENLVAGQPSSRAGASAG